MAAAVAVLGVTTAVVYALARVPPARIRAEARDAAQAASARAGDALTNWVASVELKTQNAATNPRLAAALDGDVDIKTLRDLFESEPWWAEIRREFPVYALVRSGDVPEVVAGADPAAIGADALARRARERNAAVSALGIVQGVPFVTAATVVSGGSRVPPPVLVLARPVDPTVLARMVERAGGAVLLTDGRRSLVGAGPMAELARAKAAVGRLAPGDVLSDEPSGTAVAAVALKPPIELLTHASAPASAQQIGRLFTGLQIGAGVLGALLAGLALALAFGARRTQRVKRPTRRDGTPVLSRTGSVTGPTSSAGFRGTTMGRYMLVERIGGGEMAEVFIAVAVGEGGFRRPFVIKRLRAELAENAEAVAQFTREARLAAALMHPNIAPVFEFGRIRDNYFLAQEYIVGRDLGRVTRRRISEAGGPLPPAAVVRVALETLKALEYAHARKGDNGQPLGLVHRDISPANIMISLRGEVKLVDFGVVKASERGYGQRGAGAGGAVTGNLSFMSPEQARGKEVDARADLFALGLVMYFALTGEPLYRGTGVADMLIKAGMGPGAEERARLEALAAPFDRILRRALAPTLGARYQTAASFAAELAPLLRTGAGDLERIMGELFEEELAGERQRFAGATSDLLDDSEPETDPDLATGSIA